MKRGELWLVNLDPTIGDELRKTRPVVIVNDDEIGVLALRVVVPMFIRRLGVLLDEVMDEIADSLAVVLRIE